MLGGATLRLDPPRQKFELRLALASERNGAKQSKADQHHCCRFWYRSERNVVKINRGRLRRNCGACAVEKDSRRRRGGRCGNGGAKQGVRVGSGCKTLVARVPSDIPQDSPLVAVSLTTRQSIGIERESVDRPPGHWYRGLVKLNHWPGTGTGKVNLIVERPTV